MADGFLGAEPQQLIELAGTMRDAAAKLDGASKSLTGKISLNMRWQGPDAARLKSDWHSRHVPRIAAASALLNNSADGIIKQANEQISASAAMGTADGAGNAGGMTAPPPPASGSSADDVKKWWDSMTDDQRQDYVRTHPAEAGNTDGIPMEARAEANRITAEQRLHELENTANYTEESMREKDYLRKVIDGKIQLVAYDPKNGNLIEMIGTLSPDTTTVLTYVPGTLATDDSFFDGSAQGVAHYLARADTTGGTVAFVYKNSEFPQDPTMLQSRDQGFGMTAGQKLHDFESGLGLEVPPGAQTVAVSHSWGEGAVSSAEYYGSHYDKQISLSGAWMPDDWKADPNTEYHHFSYDFYALRTAQGLGAVAEQYPGHDPSFAQHVYDDPNDNFQIGPVKITTNPNAKIENHSLIANADDPRNRQAMQDLARAVY